MVSATWICLVDLALSAVCLDGSSASLDACELPFDGALELRLDDLGVTAASDFSVGWT